jgi:ABC-2 type transport system ATP-binding protein
MTAFEAHSLSKQFGEVKALDCIDLSIEEGEFYGLLGPNGAGKSTLMKLLAGLMAPDGGELKALGKIVKPWTPQSELGVVPQEIALYDMLSAQQNLEIFGRLRGLCGVELTNAIERVLELVELTKRRKDTVKTFSGGMKRRLNLAVGLLHDPNVLLLDEPTVGVDPQSRSKIFELLLELHHRGKTILYTTHYMEEAERLCRRIGIIDRGHLIVEGTLQELLKKVQQPRSVRLRTASDSQNPPIFNGAILVKRDEYLEWTPTVHDKLGELVSQIESSGFSYERMEIVEPSLETLFLELTGKELRD